MCNHTLPLHQDLDILSKTEGMIPVTQQVQEQVGKCVPVNFKLPFISDLWCDWKQKAEKKKTQHDPAVCGIPFSQITGDRTKVNGHKLCQGRFRWVIKKNSFIERVVKP